MLLKLYKRKPQVNRFITIPEHNLIDEILQSALQFTYLYIEFNIVSVKLVIVVIQQIMLLDLEFFNDTVKLQNKLVHSFQIMTSKAIELMNRPEHVYQLYHTAAE